MHQMVVNSFGNKSFAAKNKTKLEQKKKKKF